MKRRAAPTTKELMDLSCPQASVTLIIAPRFIDDLANVAQATLATSKWNC